LIVSGLPGSFVEVPGAPLRIVTPGGNPVRPDESGLGEVSGAFVSGFEGLALADVEVAGLAVPPSRDAQETRTRDRDDASRRWNELRMVLGD
jgi:hypothetical protein